MLEKLKDKYAENQAPFRNFNFGPKMSPPKSLAILEGACFIHNEANKHLLTKLSKIAI